MADEKVSYQQHRPRLADLFCGAGGAGTGYDLAGFDVVGVDIFPQPHYPFEFVQADALTFDLAGFDAVHASPPCQFHSVMRAHRPHFDYPDLLPPTRALLAELSVPWVLENVPGSPGPWHLMLCGTMFGLRVKRHRYFQANWPLPTLTPPCQHGALLDMYSSRAKGRNGTDRSYVDAMGITWAPLENHGPEYPNGRQKLAQQAIPPSYTEFIGRALVAARMVA